MRVVVDRGRLPGMDIDLAGLLRPGFRLGDRYRLAEPIGVGGMAVVWRASDTVLARTVAVKLLAPHSRDSQSPARIRHEARAAASLSHPNIAQVHDYGEQVVAGELVPYVVLELVAGGTLLDRLRDGELPPRQALRVGAEVAAALAAAHATGLVHRDIKPANVMLAPTGAKVVDFGIAAASGPVPGGDTMLGTPTYVAPERLTSNEVLPASDVYALGVLLYRMLAGQTPWPDERPTKLLANHLYTEPPPLVPLRPVPTHVLDLCTRCLRKDPAARPTAREAAHLLAHAAGFTAIEDTTAPPGPAGATPTEPSIIIRPPVRHRVGKILRPAATVLFLAAAGTAAWVSTRGDTAAPPDRPGAAVSPTPSGAPSPTTTSTATTTTTTATAARPGAQPTNAPGIQPGGGLPAGLTGAPATAGLPHPTTSTTAAPPTPPSPAPTTSPPAPPATTPPNRTLSSAGGSITVNCPSSATAQILSWTAARSYHLTKVDTAAGPSPAAAFAHGNDTVTMTVTCDDGVPTAQTS